MPVVISCDDPSFWEATPLSHDFYAAFLGISPAGSDLRTLKKLARNSLKYSSLGSEEKKIAYDKWQQKWEQFIESLIAEGNGVSKPLWLATTPIALTILMVLKALLVCWENDVDAGVNAVTWRLFGVSDGCMNFKLDEDLLLIMVFVLFFLPSQFRNQTNDNKHLLFYNYDYSSTQSMIVILEQRL